MKVPGFVNLRGAATASTNEDSVWPAFTDVMMVIVMVANFVRATLAFQAEVGTFFAAFNGGIGEGLNPQVTASSPVSEFLAVPPVSPVPPVGPVVVPRNEIKGGTPSKHDGVPGWYSDPYGGIGHLRWWEGENWSETKTAQPGKD